MNHRQKRRTVIATTIRLGRQGDIKPGMDAQTVADQVAAELMLEHSDMYGIDLALIIQIIEALWPLIEKLLNNWFN